MRCRVSVLNTNCASQTRQPHACPVMLTHGLYFRTAPQATLSLHKPMREPKPFAPSPRLPAFGALAPQPNTVRLGSPVGAPLMKYNSRRSTTLFGPSADPRPFPPRGRTAQTLHSAHGCYISQAGQTHLTGRSCFMQTTGHEASPSRPLTRDWLSGIELQRFHGPLSLKRTLRRRSA